MLRAISGSLPRKVLIAAGVLIVGGLLLSIQFFRTPDRIIEDLLVFKEGNAVLIQVKFAVPVRYENHFPEGKSDLLQVKVRAIGAGETREYVGREALLRGFAEQVPLTDVAFEADVPGGPFLTLRFSEAVPYQVSEDVAKKSILIRVPEAFGRN